jgi:MFS family permease
MDNNALNKYSELSYYYPYMIIMVLLFLVIQIISWYMTKQKPLELTKKEKSLKQRYVAAYIISKAAIWAKAPYNFLLLSTIHGFSIQEIGILYMIESICSLISGPLMGMIADTYGRKMIANIFPIHTIIVLSLRLSGNRPLAYTAQFISGLCKGILGTVYESWLNYEIAEFDRSKELKKEIFTDNMFYDSVLSFIVTVIGAILFVNIINIEYMGYICQSRLCYMPRLCSIPSHILAMD